ncbi:MAG: hypothetical protein AB1700_18305 [Bacillota bacterium]
MRDKRRWIAVAVVLAIVAATASLAALVPNRAKILVDTGETRASVESSLDRLLPATVDSPRDPRLIAAAERLKGEPYIASVWVVDSAGNIVFHWRGSGKESVNVSSLAERDMGRVLEGIGPGAFSELQKLQLLTVAAIRSEEEHNDVLRHLIRPVQGDGGLPAALVAVAYDVSPYVRGPAACGVILTLVLVVGLAVYWLGLPLWVYLDASSRGEAAVLWGAFVLLTNLVGLLAYLIVISKPRR